MRNIYQVLYRKEQQLQQIRKEVEVLRIVLPLLEDDPPVNSLAAKPAVIPFERARNVSQHLPAALSE